MNVLDLFSGIGGFSLGLERAGMRTVAFCEIDPYCRRVLARRWPGVPVYNDVRELSGQRLWDDGNTTSIQVICGGFPCQDISLAGRGAGLSGERSGLWFEYARLIGDLRPQFVIVENVSELLGRGLGDVLGSLAALGYDAEWHCIPAAALGAPHIRDRVWIIAYPNGQGLAGQGQAIRLSAVGAGTREWDAIAKEIGDNFRELRAGRASSPKPFIRRGDDGFADWAHRIRALGNAVVPQIPEIIGRAIMQFELPRALST